MSTPPSVSLRLPSSSLLSFACKRNDKTSRPDLKGICPPAPLRRESCFFPTSSPTEQSSTQRWCSFPKEFNAYNLSHFLSCRYGTEVQRDQRAQRWERSACLCPGRYPSSIESSPVTQFPCWGAHYFLGSGSGFWEALPLLPLASPMGPARSLVAIQRSLLSGAAPQRFGAKMGSP